MNNRTFHIANRIMVWKGTPPSKTLMVLDQSQNVLKRCILHNNINKLVPLHWSVPQNSGLWCILFQDCQVIIRALMFNWGVYIAPILCLSSINPCCPWWGSSGSGGRAGSSWMDEWMDERRKGWMDGVWDGWMVKDGWMDIGVARWMDGSIWCNDRCYCHIKYHKMALKISEQIQPETNQHRLAWRGVCKHVFVFVAVSSRLAKMIVWRHTWALMITVVTAEGKRLANVQDVFCATSQMTLLARILPQ